MATQKETVLIDLKIEGTENESKINALSASINKLTEENKKLAETNKALAKAEGDNTEQIAKNSSEIEANKQVIQQGNATRKGLIQTIAAEDNSIKALNIRNADLRKQRDLINTSTDEGRKRIAAINAQIDINNTKIKENSSALEKQKLNIGNYSSALDGIKGSLGNAIPGFKGMSDGISGVTSGLTALNGPLIAITLGIKLISEVISKSEPVLDFFEDWFTKASAVANAFINNITLVGNIIKEVFSGNFGAAAVLTEELAGALGDAADESYRLLEATRALEDAEMLFRVESAAAANQMKAYVVAAKNKSLSIEESNALLQKASDLENEITEKAVKNAQARADIEEGKLIESKRTQLEAANLLRQAGESQAEYIQKLINSGLFSPEQLDPLIAAYEKVQQEASAGLAFQEKVANQQEVLREKLKVAEEKRIKELEEKRAIDGANRRAESESIAIEQLQIQELYQERSIELTTTFEKSINDVQKKFSEQRTEFKKQEQKNYEEIERQKLQTTRIVLNGLGASLAAFGIQSKGLSSGLALANTFLGVTEILKSPAAPFIEPFASIVRATQIATTIATGLGAVARINSVQFGGAAAGGGNFLTKGPTLLLVGDNPGGVERVSVEPLSGRGQTRVNNGVLAMAGGGTLTTGSEIRTAYGQAQSTASMANLMNQVKTVLVLQDFEAVQMSRNNDVERATVVL